MGDMLRAFEAWLATDTGVLSAALLVLHVVVAGWVTCHILLTKENVRASAGWIGLVILSPFIGSAAYWIFGVNRIRRHFAAPIDDVGAGDRLHDLSESMLPLVNGDEAYPAMLEAIGSARQSIALSSYIFDRDPAGKRFVEALGAARDRGVEVRVLVDDVGIRYSRRPIDRDLRSRGIATARFMPTRSLSFLAFVNLRSHRKLLIVDGETAFIGGMNIRHGNCVAENPRAPVQDVHFRVRGPVVAALTRVFEEDWEFATGEAVRLPRPAPGPWGYPGKVRVIADGPDDGLDKLQWTFLAALSTATRSARIVTPYFLPNEVLISGFEVALMKGVIVEIIVPAKSNLFYMDWPMRAVLERMVKRGVHVYLAPPPFDHSKIFLVDDEWCSIGSSNWDDRSLRLNFEVNLEIYDWELAGKLHRLVDRKRAAAHRLTVEEVRAVPVLRRLRNRFFRLFSPYL
jgi:cardiolipin synthase